MPPKTRQIKDNGDQTVTVRTVIPASLWSVVRELAVQWRIKDLQALDIVMQLFAKLVEESNGRVLGSFFQTAYESLLAKDAMPLDGLPSIDVSKLHRSHKTKSGFVGVYVNGKGFRAMARSGVDSTQKSIGTFQTAERAAWARYLHYKKLKLAYGQAEVELESSQSQYWREILQKSLDREPTDEELIALLNQERERLGDPPIVIDYEASSSEPGPESTKEPAFKYTSPALEKLLKE